MPSEYTGILTQQWGWVEGGARNTHSHARTPAPSVSGSTMWFTHKESSHNTSKSFNSSTSGNRARDRMGDEDFWDFDLPISRRGRFFQDSTFEDTRSDFDKKVKDILSKWGDDDFLGDAWGDDTDRRHTSNLNRYRDLRSSRNLSDDNQAVTVTSKDDAHKIVLDVMDFVAGDVKVKVVGELELLVEGRLEAAADGGSPRTFKRNFTLPQHTDMEAVTSVMSADGILTITAPKKKTGVSGSNTGATSGLKDTSTSNKGEHTASSSSTNTTRDENQSRSGQHTASDFFRDVPFKKRGRFFDDACFEDTRWDFDKRVKDILSKWGDDDFLGDAWGDDTDRRHTSNLNRYRNLRNSRNLSDDNQAVTVTSKDDAHKIVLDVMNFVAGDVKVKVVGELELLVEGRLEAAADGGSPRTFKRNFTLPQHTDMEAVTSVMSADGILTITAPKKATRGRDEGKESHVNISNKNVSESRASSSSASSVNSKMENVQQEMDKLKNGTKGEVAESVQTAVKINTTVDAPQTAATTTQQESSQNITYSQETEAGLKTNLVEAPRVMGQTTQESSENITLSRETTGETVPTIQVTTSANTESEEKAATSLNRGCEESATVTATTTTTTQPSQQQEKVCLVGRTEERRGSKGVALPIVTKGQFFNDSFFEGTWKNYQDAVRDVLARWDRSSSPVPSDDMTSYRKLRTRDMRDENQAVTTSEDESNYKYVVDVHDFTTSGGEVTVNVLEEGQLVVEGRVEREEGGARASRHFTREFTLPRNVQQEDIVAVMSSDGVLTIIAPKQKLVCGGSESKETQAMESVRASQAVESVRASQALESVRESQGMESMRESQTGKATTTTTESQTIHGGRKEEDVQEFVIPVIVGEASERNLLLEMSDATSQKTQREKGASFEGLENFNDEECHKKPAGGKDCGFIDESDVDAVHRRLGEDKQKTQASQTSGEGEQTVEAEKMRRVKRVYQEEDEPYMNRLLNIRTGGGFHEDSHFAGYQNDLKAAIKEVLHKFREPVDESKGEMAAYRNLRERDLRLENQATHIDEKPLSQTVVMDVFDFMGGEVTAEVVDGRELLVKGHTKRRHGSCLTTLTFVKPIPLPEYADLKGIHAFVSSDGVLIVNIPKLEESYEVIDLAKELSLEHRPRLGTPTDHTQRVSGERGLRDSPLELEGRVYRMSPHRILADHNITPRDRSRDRL
ncbi:hypothetical protein Pcinc_026027 [Petrolisthes cinctipes]|uniref:SHSP domain-containing protein n=1 Tax=Petrolisthes cinctipes TaxID=88211 RepID=A0AAE1F8A6_PETCI|nr:hypothetical protein Pcinc_026027 [Petrolisthes cinctipes]